MTEKEFLTKLRSFLNDTIEYSKERCPCMYECDCSAIDSGKIQVAEEVLDMLDEYEENAN